MVNSSERDRDKSPDMQYIVELYVSVYQSPDKSVTRFGGTPAYANASECHALDPKKSEDGWPRVGILELTGTWRSKE